jgi:YegS/Rv2252/BmrU family lipid kinase
MSSTSSRRLLFVINPIAGTRSKAGLQQYLHHRAGQAGCTYKILYSHRHTDAAAIASAATEWQATDVIACGGDGTVNMVAGAVCNTNMRLGIIAVGSGNGLARTAGIPLKPSAAFDVILLNKVVAADSFWVNEKFACMLSGMGLDAAVASSFGNSGQRGLVNYVRQTFRQFWKAKPYAFALEMDELTLHTQAFFISVANSNQYGNNVKIAPMASISDGLLDIIIAQKMPRLALLFAVLYQLSGNNRLQRLSGTMKQAGVLYYQSRSLRVKNLAMAPLHIDGDPVVTAGEVAFRINPASVQLLVP